MNDKKRRRIIYAIMIAFVALSLLLFPLAESANNDCTCNVDACGHLRSCPLRNHVHSDTPCEGNCSCEVKEGVCYWCDLHVAVCSSAKEVDESTTQEHTDPVSDTVFDALTTTKYETETHSEVVSELASEEMSSDLTEEFTEDCSDEPTESISDISEDSSDISEGKREFLTEIAESSHCTCGAKTEDPYAEHEKGCYYYLAECTCHDSDGELIHENGCPKISKIEEIIDAIGSNGATEPSGDRTVYTYEDDKILITATLSDAGSISDTAELNVEHITEDKDAEKVEEYSQLVEDEIEQQLKTENPDELVGCDVFAYDISFIDGGVEVEPTSGTVSVNLQYKETVVESENIENVKVFHVEEKRNDTELVDVGAVVAVSKDNSIEAINFDTDSFSVYLVTNNFNMSSSLSYTILNDESQTFINSTYYQSNRVLGVAGNFHLVGFDTVELSAHTNGNVLANNLNANVNFGTNNLANEVSYAQNYLRVNSSSSSAQNHLLALGSSNTVALGDNGNRFMIGSTMLDRPKNIIQDDDTATLPFIDLNAVRADIEYRSSVIANMEECYISNHLSNSGSCDGSYVEITDNNKIGVMNITAAQLSSYSYFGVKGFVTGGDGTVVVNVDCTGVTTVDMPVSLVYIDGIAQSVNETTDFENDGVIWNFLNCDGVAISTDRMSGNIIAPGADVTVYQNLNGTVIADNITIRAESHRADLITSVPSVWDGIFDNGSVDLEVHKVWEDSRNHSADSVGVELYRSVAGGTASTTIPNMVVTVNYKLNSTSNSQTATYYVTPGGTITLSMTPVSAGWWSYRYVWVSTNGGSSYSCLGSGTRTTTLSNVVSNRTVNVVVSSSSSNRNTTYYLTSFTASGDITSSPGTTTTTQTQGYDELVETVTLSAENEWSYSWTTLPTSFNDNYYIREVAAGNTPLSGYVTRYYDIDDVQINTTSQLTLEDDSTVDAYQITDTYAKIVNSPVTTKTIHKVWEDGGNRHLDESVSVQLYADGVPYGSAVAVGYDSNGNLLSGTTANNDGSWSYTWTGLPEYRFLNDTYTAILYTAAEVSPPADYAVSYNTTSMSYTYNNAPVTSYIFGALDGLTVTNTPLTDIGITKSWSDGNLNHATDNITVQLYKNGVATGSPVTVGYSSTGVLLAGTVINVDGSWSYTWEDLLAYDDGVALTYSVVETQINGTAIAELPFEAIYSALTNGIITITNNLRIFSFTLVKTDSETDARLAGAGFRLEVEDENGDWLPVISGNDTLYTNSNGEIFFDSLLEYGNNYRLVEISAPSGYCILKEPIMLEFSSDGIISAANTMAILTNGEETVLNVADMPMFTAPAVGGIGTTIFTVCGILLIVGAVTCYILVSKKKKNEGGDKGKKK